VKEGDDDALASGEALCVYVFRSEGAPVSSIVSLLISVSTRMHTVYLIPVRTIHSIPIAKRGIDA